jgi:hypothetical protein
VFVTGTVWNGGAFGYDVLTQAFATAGGPPVWSAPSHRVGDDFAADMAVNIGGWVYVTGKASNGVDFDYLTTKLESLDGSALWNIAYNAPSGGTDAAASIALLDTANVRYPDVLQLSAKYATIRYTQSQ